MRKSWRNWFVHAIIVPCGLLPLVATAAPAGGPPPVAIDTSSDNTPAPAQPQPLPATEPQPAPATLEPTPSQPTPAKPIAPESDTPTLAAPPAGAPTPAAPPATAPAATAPASGVPTPAAPRGAAPQAAAPAATATVEASVIAGPKVEIRPAAFQGITPGQNTREELVKILGAPAETIPANGTEVLVYRPVDFSRVEAVVSQGQVRSLVVHLKAPASVANLVRDLGFQAFSPARVCDSEGREIGVAFPERGVMFAFTTEAGEPAVTQLVLETISAESFLVRAEQSGTRNYTQALGDLAHAEKLGAPAARIHARRAELLGDMGQPTAALSHVEDALRAEPASPRLHLIKAKLLGEIGEYEAAAKEASAAIAPGDVAWNWKARGECLLGDFLGAGRERNFEGALEHHRAAVKLATPLVGDSRPSTRREAKEILAKAHLAIARDIASGDWRNKKEAVPKWLRKGGELVDDFLRTEGGDTLLRLHLYCEVMGAYSAAGDLFDPASAADTGLKEARTLMAESPDAAFQHVVEWRLGTSLTQVARLQRDRGQFDSALQLADNAAALVAAAAKSREVSANRDYAVAQLFYVIGSIHAIGKGDHHEAVAFYDKALSLVGEQLPNSAEARQGEHGEMLVSMGVSCWEEGQRERAVTLSETGAMHIRRAIESGTFTAEALAVPYANLSNMHQQLGHNEQALRFGEMAKRSTPATATAGKEATQAAPVKR